MTDDPAAAPRLLAEERGLAIAWERFPEAVATAQERGGRVLAPLPAGYRPTSEPALVFRPLPARR